MGVGSLLRTAKSISIQINTQNRKPNKQSMGNHNQQFPRLMTMVQIQNSSKWMKDLKNILKETIKEIMGDFLYNLGVMKDFLIITENLKATKEKISLHIRLH